MPAPSRLLWRNEKGLSPELPTLGPQLGLDAQWIAVKMRITRHRRRRYQDAQSRLVTIGEDFHRFLKKISFCATVFPAWMGISKVEGLNSKISATKSSDLPPLAPTAR